MNIQEKLLLKRIWDDAYYFGKPIVSDATYDKNKSEIRNALDGDSSLMDQFGTEFFATSYSSLENSGGDIKHKFPMTSLDKTNDMTIIEKKIKTWSDAKSKTQCVMWKVDGSSVSIRYSGGILTQALTRHTGEYGKDLTVSAYQIKNLPKTVSDLREFEVRAEMVIKKQDFNLLNESLLARGETTYKNPRNASAGISQTKTAAKVAELRLSAIAYDVLGIEFESHQQKLKFLVDLGFDVVEWVVTKNGNHQEILSEMETRRFDLEYDVDGAVLMVDETPIRNDLGFSSETPNFAFAFKFKDVELEFEIDDSEFESGIEWSFGATGVFTPRAHFKKNPLSEEVFGVSITHSTLHNVSELSRLGWTTKSTHAFVKRAGMVIPKVIEAYSVPFTSDGETPKPPEKCPACGGKTGFKGEVFMCLNDDCDGKSFNRILRFIKSMEIDEIGETTLSKIVESGLVSFPHDLYSLKPSDISSLDRLGETSAKKIIENIQNSKSRPLWRVLNGLMITGLGETTSKACSEVWENLEDFFLNASKIKLQNIEKIGPIISENIISGMDRDSMKLIINSLISIGVGMAKEEKVTIVGKLSGKTFCLTGSPEIGGQKAKKAILEKMITDAGGVIGKMGKTLDFLVAGPDSISEGSAKLERAKNDGTSIVSGDDVVSMIS